MRKIREILRHKGPLGLTHRETALRVGVSIGSVTKVMRRAHAVQLDWEMASTLDEDTLAGILEGPREKPGKEREKPDPVWIHTERKRAGVTLEILHLEYLQSHPAGYRYTQFCSIYRAWLKDKKLSMRQKHVAGEKLFIDYSGKKARICDAKTGVFTEVELFVATLGASNFTYVEATRTQQSADFIQSHIRAFEYLGGVPALIVPDQLKSGVTTSCIYDPKIQRTYEEMAQHYGTSVMPARPRKPKDKSKVEVAVQVIQRWILARIRNDIFTSLGALNKRILELVNELNEREMKTYKQSRRALFETLDKPVLQPLPRERFVFADFSVARVAKDYHVEAYD